MSVPTVVDSSQPANAPATIWELYNEKAKFRDRARLQDWNSSINSLLLFAAIFAAVLVSLCVETLNLLQQEPQNSIVEIQKILMYIALKDTDPSHLPPAPTTNFVPPQWAVAVNVLFFTSLSASILAAVGSVTCLQWVGEYDVGLEDASTPQQRALRWHYRYRSTETWYMRQMIASLPILLYISVTLFLIGLKVWFSHVYHPLDNVPLVCLVIWAGGYATTNFLTIIFPSVPYRTPVSRLLFRFLRLSQFYLWKAVQAAIVLAPHLIRFLVHSYRSGPATFNQYRHKYIVKRALYAREMEEKRARMYPWMPPGRDHWQSMHAQLWERGKVEEDKTLPLSAIAWLANSTNLTKHSRAEFELVIEALDQLSDNQLSVWPEYNVDAPWSYIFNLVLGPPGEHPHRRSKFIPILANLLKRMSLHPMLFQRMVPEMDHELLTAFMTQLARQPPQAAIQAEKRLQSITTLVSSKMWGGMSPIDQPSYQTLQVIYDCLKVIPSGPSDGSTAWIFTLCRRDILSSQSSDAVEWPDPEYINLATHAFHSEVLRRAVIERYVTFVDMCLVGSRKSTDGTTTWRWFHPSVSSTLPYRAAGIKILGEHLLRFLFTEEEDAANVREFMKDLASRSLHPALKLVLSICSRTPEDRQSRLNRHPIPANPISRDGQPSRPNTNPTPTNASHAEGQPSQPTSNVPMQNQSGSEDTLFEVPLPSDDDPLWSDGAWIYAILFWFNFRGRWTGSLALSDNPNEPPLHAATAIQRIVAQGGRFDDKALEMVSHYAKLLVASTWRNIIDKTRNIRSFALYMDSKQWLEVFAGFMQDDFPTDKSDVFTALLHTLFDLFPTTRSQIMWVKTGIRIMNAALSPDEEEDELYQVDSQPTAAADAPHRRRNSIFRIFLAGMRQEKMTIKPEMIPSPLPGLMNEISSRLEAAFQGQPLDPAVLRACIVLTDNLAIHYARRKRPDDEIRTKFRAIGRAIANIDGMLDPQRLPQNIPPHAALDNGLQTLAQIVVTSSEAIYGWRTNLTSALENCQEAGGISRSHTHASITLRHASIIEIPVVSTPQPMDHSIEYMEKALGVIRETSEESVTRQDGGASEASTIRDGHLGLGRE